jgi:hypothetical protein
MKKSEFICSLCHVSFDKHNGEEHIRLLEKKFKGERNTYKSRRAKYVILRFPNTSKGLKSLADTKKEMKRTYYMGGPTYFRVYGRCKNVREVFKKTGRHYDWFSPRNDISMKSKEAKYCYAWVLYVRPVVKKRA